MGRFHQAYPQYQLRLDANARPVDLLQDASVDVAIRYSQKRYPALVAACSLPESFGVYGAPALAARAGRGARRPGSARAGHGALARSRGCMMRAGGNGARRPACRAGASPPPSMPTRKNTTRCRRPSPGRAWCWPARSWCPTASAWGAGAAAARSVCRARPIPRCARRARTASAGARLPGLAGARIRGLSRARAAIMSALLTRRSPSGPRPQPENADREPIPRNDRVPGGGRGAELRRRAPAADVGALGHAQRGRAGSGGWACCCCCAPRAAFG